MPHWSFLQLRPIVKSLMDVTITKGITQLFSSPFFPHSKHFSLLPALLEKGDDKPFCVEDTGLYGRPGLPFQNHLRLETEKAGGAAFVRPFFC